MNIFMNYNFLQDINALDPFLASVDNINNVEISNGIYDHYYLTKDVSSAYSSTVPTDWDVNTLMDCNFNGNISAGNIETIASNITQVKIKKRKLGEYTWMTIKEIDINQPSDLSFAFTDNFNIINTEYEYAYVPILSGVEGDYITSKTLAQFDGVYVCDADTIFKLYAGVAYDSTSANQKIGAFEVFGRQYPVIVSNGVINYQSGGVSGTILPPDYLSTRKIDREAIVKQRDAYIKFLTNKKPKVIKDWNGNNWLCFITGNPTTSYNNNYGMGIVDVNATWTEIGKLSSNNDMYRAGLIPSEN